MKAEVGPGTFAIVLRRLRESRSLTQEELAARSGITAKAVSALERGERRRPYPHTVRSLADALDLADGERAELVDAVPRRSTTLLAEPDAGTAPTAFEVLPSPGADRSAFAPIFGRENEIERVVHTMTGSAARLLTLTGSGGVGKTRLALAMLDRLRDEVGTTGFVDLSAVREPAQVLPRVAAALGVVDGASAGGDPSVLVDRIAGHLAGRSAVLVIDNLEQVLAVGPIIAELLTRTPGLTLLATSRAPLRIRAEREVVITALALPDGNDPAAVAASPAVAMFLDRAAATGMTWEVSDDTAETLADIARRLDGLPLALELAAPATRVLSPSALLDRLQEHGPDAGLGSAPHDLPDRQRTMAAVIDWSIDLLEPEEAELLARLAVFSGGFSLDTVEAVTARASAPSPPADVLPVLTTLVEHSLVVPTTSPDGIPRLRLLEPVRQYAAVRSQATGVAAATATAQADVFHDLAVDAQRRLMLGGIGPLLDRLDADHGNLRSAFLRLLELDRPDDAAELVGSLWTHLGIRGHAREGLAWLNRLSGSGSGIAAAHAAVARMGLLLVVGDVTGMRREGAIAIPLAEASGSLRLRAEAGVLAGLAAVFAGDLGEGRRLLRREFPLDDGAAARWLDVHCRVGLGQADLVAGDVSAAEEVLGEALTIARDIGNEFTLTSALNTLATVHEVRGDDAAAAALLRESLAIAWPLRLSWSIAYAVPALGGVAARTGDAVAAATLFGAATTLGASTAIDPHFPPSRQTADAGFEVARKALGEKAFVAAWESGRTMQADAVASLVDSVAAEVIRRARG